MGLSDANDKLDFYEKVKLLGNQLTLACPDMFSGIHKLEKSLICTIKRSEMYRTLLVVLKASNDFYLNVEMDYSSSS